MEETETKCGAPVGIMITLVVLALLYIWAVWND